MKLVTDKKCPGYQICEVLTDVAYHKNYCLGNWEACEHAQTFVKKRPPREWSKK